jgi:hypothetical protein
MAQGHQRLAARLEVAVCHADRRLFVRASQELGHLVAAVVDQRLVDASVAGGAICGEILDIERLDNVDHEVGTSDTSNSRQILRRCGLGGDGLCVWR